MAKATHLRWPDARCSPRRRSSSRCRGSRDTHRRPLSHSAPLRSGKKDLSGEICTYICVHSSVGHVCTYTSSGKWKSRNLGILDTHLRRAQPPCLPARLYYVRLIFVLSYRVGCLFLLLFLVLPSAFSFIILFVRQDQCDRSRSAKIRCTATECH